jgi:hypothetical protein
VSEIARLLRAASEGRHRCRTAQKQDKIAPLLSAPVQGKGK